MIEHKIILHDQLTSETATLDHLLFIYSIKGILQSSWIVGLLASRCPLSELIDPYMVKEI